MPAAVDEATPDSDLTIAVLPGDGIGIEVMDAALVVLQQLQLQVPGLQLRLQHCPAGAAEYQRSGTALPAETLLACRNADAVLLGA
ncbi:MAG: isocitrate/isopropylmalate family dehydrogenase, partial [Planctomycetaceae bacterium]